MFGFKYKEFDFSHKYDSYTTPEEDYAKHLHYFYEIIYFVRGDVTYCVELEKLKLSPGDIVVIPPGKYHFASVSNQEHYERYVLKFPVEVIPDFLKVKIDNDGPFFTNNRKFELSFNQFDNYVTTYTNEEIEYLVAADILKILILITNQPKYRDSYQQVFISKIIDYIDANIKSNLSLETFVKEFHFSKSYISNEFKKYMKVSLMKYIKSKKIIEAHKLILAGQKKTAVAKQFGFDDYSTFYRSYTKMLNDTKNSHN